jgi:hypothetical protein
MKHILAEFWIILNAQIRAGAWLLSWSHVPPTQRIQFM